MYVCVFSGIKHFPTYHFDNSIKLHRSSVDYGQKNIRFSAGQSTVISELDPPVTYRGTDLTFVIVFQTLTRLPAKKKNVSILRKIIIFKIKSIFALKIFCESNNFLKDCLPIIRIKILIRSSQNYVFYTFNNLFHR